MKDGKTEHFCDTHLGKVAKIIDNLVHLAPNKGMKSVGSLSPFSLKMNTDFFHRELRHKWE